MTVLPGSTPGFRSKFDTPSVALAPDGSKVESPGQVWRNIPAL